MAGGYAYDQSGQSYFFFLTVLLLFLAPFTYTTLRGGSEKAASRVPYPCAGWNVKSSDVKRAVGVVSGTFSPRYILLSLGWLAFAFVVQQASLYEPDGIVYDPFKILGISPGLSNKDIKRHYRRMSVKLHPDKVVLIGNLTKEAANDIYVELTKAYKALTDEIVRTNFELYGHPDGKQEFSQGIALPSWIVESKNVWWVMGSYALVLGVMLPFFVGRWWYGSRRRTKDGILNTTAGTYFRTLKEDTTFPTLLTILASSDEFVDPASIVPAIRKKAIKSKAGVDEYARLASIVREKEGKDGWDGYGSWTVGKKRARVLLSSHLHRIPINDSALLRERLETVAQAMSLLSGLASICLASSWLSTYILILHLQQFLLQAVHPSSSPLLQLPHVTTSIVEAAHKVGVETIEDFGSMNAGDVEKVMETAGGTGRDKEKREAWNVAKSWPIVKFEDAKFQVVGEKIVTPGSIVNFIIKLKIDLPGAQKPIANGVHADNDVQAEGSVEGKEQSIEELIGRRSKSEEGVQPTPLAHAPHYPKNRKPSWYIFVGDHKLNRVFVQPQKFTDMGPDAIRTIRLSFQAPGGPGLYTFQAYVMSDSFVGTDVQKDMRMKVEPPPTGTETVAEEDDISEPEEDSIAGQMALMKGLPVKRIDDDDDDTSGTDDDEEDEDTSDSDSD